MSGFRAQCVMALIVLAGIAIIPFAPQLGSALRAVDWGVPPAIASSGQQVDPGRSSERLYMVATDLVLDAPGCTVELDGLQVEPVAGADGSYLISPEMVLTDDCFPTNS